VKNPPSPEEFAKALENGALHTTGTVTPSGAAGVGHT